MDREATKVSINVENIGVRYINISCNLFSNFFIYVFEIFHDKILGKVKTYLAMPPAVSILIRILIYSYKKYSYKKFLICRMW